MAQERRDRRYLIGAERVLGEAQANIAKIQQSDAPAVRRSGGRLAMGNKQGQKVGA